MRDEKAIEYLTGTAPGQRGLPREIVEEAIERNILRLLPSDHKLAEATIRAMVPEDLLVDAQLWKKDPEKPWKGPWIARRPIWFIAPNGSGAERV
jgi:hypothetical protein